MKTARYIVMGLPAGALLLLAYIALGQERAPWPPRAVTPPEIKAETPLPPRADGVRGEPSPFPVVAPDAFIEERPAAPNSANNIIRKAYSGRVTAYTPGGSLVATETLPPVVNQAAPSETKPNTPPSRVEVPPFPVAAPATNIVRKVSSSGSRVTGYTPSGGYGESETSAPLPPVVNPAASTKPSPAVPRPEPIPQLPPVVNPVASNEPLPPVVNPSPIPLAPPVPREQPIAPLPPVVTPSPSPVVREEPSMPLPPVVKPAPSPIPREQPSSLSPATHVSTGRESSPSVRMDGPGSFKTQSTLPSPVAPPVIQQTQYTEPIRSTPTPDIKPEPVRTESPRPEPRPVPPPPLPPEPDAITNDLPPPAPPPPLVQPVAPKVVETPPPLPKVETPPKAKTEALAPVTPWSPKDTEPQPEPRIVPSVPVNNPRDQANDPNKASRFVVQPKPAVAPPVVQIAPVAQPEPRPMPTPSVRVDTGPQYFTPIKVWRTNDAAKPAKLTNNSKPVEIITPIPNGDASSSSLTPQLTVDKKGPLFQKTGGSMTYRITLRNIGGSTAQMVRVEDDIPGMTLVNSTPAATRYQGDRVLWMLPSVRPGEEVTLIEEIAPLRAGELVSTTSVHVYASTSFRTTVEGDGKNELPPGPLLLTPPVLKDFALPIMPPSTTLKPIPDGSKLREMPLFMEVRSPASIAVGQKVVFEVVATNKGSTPLGGLVLYGKLPEGLSHPEGNVIGADLPELAPNETKTFRMPMTAVQPGRFQVEIRIKTAQDGEAVSTPVIVIESPGPSIQQSSNSSTNLTMQIQSRDGPIEKGKVTIFAIRVANQGSSVATNVQLSVRMSDGLEANKEFVQAPTSYRVEGRNLLFAPIAKLMPGESKSFHIEARGIAEGDQRVRAQLVSEQNRVPITREERALVYTEKQ